MRTLLIAFFLLLAIPAPGAEFLVYRGLRVDGPHWMDNLPLEHPIRKTAEFEARLRPGDIIQIYKDGTCKEPPSKGCMFWIVKVPGMSVEEAQKYSEAQVDNVLSAEPVMVARRKWNLKIADLPAPTLTAMAKDEIAELSAADMRTLTLDKTTTASVVLNP